MNPRWNLLSALFVSILLTACDRQSVVMPPYPLPSADEWQRFQRLHIVFGHQSVGANLIDGVQALAREQHIDLAIANTPTTDHSVVIQHFPIGTNGNPTSKLDAFRAALASGAAAGASVAEMKFCFVDFGNDTKPRELATAYIQQMDALSAEYSAVIFVATTSPLTTIQTGPKAWVKRLLGQDPAGYAENFRRHEFNQVLRDHYGTSPNLFDLAAIESLQGQINFNYNNQPIEALAPIISSDGGHLNADGERLVAAAWIRQLSALKLPSDEKIISTTRE